MKSFLALVLVLGGCSLELDDDDGSGGPPTVDHPPPDELAKYPTIGKDNRIGFDLESGKADRAIGVQAKADLLGFLRGSAQDVATVTSDNTAVLTIVSTAITNNFFPRNTTATVHGEAAGDTDVVFRDGAGAEIDRVTLHVRPVDKIDIDRVWGAGAARVLAGSVNRIEVSTEIAGVPAVGTGSVEFTLDGGLAVSTADDAPQFESTGDEAYFTATANGVITASTSEATTRTFNIIAVQPSELTSISRTPHALDVPAGQQGTVEAAAFVGTDPVYGVQCTWTAPAGLVVELVSFPFDGWLGAISDFMYIFHGTPGTYVATCTVPGGLTTTVNVTLH